MQFKDARAVLESILNENKELNQLGIAVNSRALKNEEAIGHPDRKDFPLLTGKEVLLQAEVDGSIGQAFTSDPIAYQGNIRGVLDLTSERLGNHALLVATLNAVSHKLGLTDHTIHCLDNEPETCAEKISQTVLERHGRCKIGIIGYQPAILENCVRIFGADNIKISDLNRNNVGSLRHGVKVLDGLTDTKEVVDFADVLLITGSILANGTERSVLDELENKQFYLFGTTCAALAKYNNFSRLCPLSK
ncbi:hypothetical protein GH808_03375 [Acetobacterium fimetarium]|uniref:Putative heavy-metal chelation domain-containing protein n=1 Tax=Acetobacterium fimetarium TaxID=52691 RepID=A0ABR6WSG4_9FIRM|nr:DUF364 domain-containing protein [Acetobacterium fimetarium]MBC3803475.1 hypothetical protein [Acetobacterium fimetarium]